jgi:hypothetical protein
MLLNKVKIILSFHLFSKKLSKLFQIVADIHKESLFTEMVLVKARKSNC